MHEHPWSYATGAGVPLPAAELRARPPHAARVSARTPDPASTSSVASSQTTGPAVDAEGPQGLTREDVMSVREVADLLDVTTRTVYRLVRDGQLPGARRIGRTVVVVRPVFEHWLLTGDG